MAKYKRSTPEEIFRRNADAYKGTKEMQDEAKKILRKWSKK